LERPQEKIKQMMDAAIAAGPLATGKGKSGKGKNGAVAGASGGMVNGTLMCDFRTEYAKSGGSVCGACEEKIPKGAVRIGKKEYDSTRAKMYGPYDRSASGLRSL
jgi:poly [ADP-ribose] polymerase